MKLVIVRNGFEDTEVERAVAAEHGVEVLDERHADDLAAAVGAAEGVLVQFAPFGEDVIARCPSLRVIGRYGVGVDNVDVEAASRRGIAVVNVPDYCVEEVATHAVALLLAAWRKLPLATDLVRSGRWPDWKQLQPIPPLSEATLGLIGVGRIGAEVVRQAGHLFSRVVVFDPLAASTPDGVESVGFEELLANSDAVSLHCPLTEETTHLMNARTLELMRPGSVLVNVSRGGLVDADALAAALESRRPGFAAVDVLETEPPEAGNPLVSHPRAILTNHVAWYSTQSAGRLRSMLADRCAAYLNGGSVPSVVNQRALEHNARS